MGNNLRKLIYSTPSLCGTQLFHIGGSADSPNMRVRVYSDESMECECDYLRGEDCHVIFKTKKCPYVSGSRET